MSIFTWFFIPETKGMSLERMDDLFGVTELVEKKVEYGEIEIPTTEVAERAGLANVAPVTVAREGETEQEGKGTGEVRVEKA